MKYPIDCDLPRKKTEYLYRAQELLRLLHNGFSKWLHEGITEEQYNKFPIKIKAKYPYIAKLAKADWNKFQREDFIPRSDKICQEICVQRAEFKKSTRWIINIGDV